MDISPAAPVRLDKADHRKTPGRPPYRLGDQLVEGNSAAAICILLRYLDGSTTAHVPRATALIGSVLRPALGQGSKMAIVVTSSRPHVP